MNHHQIVKQTDISSSSEKDGTKQTTTKRSQHLKQTMLRQSKQTPNTDQLVLRANDLSIAFLVMQVLDTYTCLVANCVFILCHIMRIEMPYFTYNNQTEKCIRRENVLQTYRVTLWKSDEHTSSLQCSSDANNHVPDLMIIINP